MFASWASKRDSLEQVIHEKNQDSTTINAKLALVEIISYTNADSALLLSSQALTLSRETNYTSGIVESLSWLSYLHKQAGNYSKSIEYLDQAIKLLDARNKQHMEHLATAKNNLASIYSEINDYNVALKYNKSALEIRMEIDDIEGIANSYYNIGIIYLNKNELDSSKHYLKKGLNILEDIKYDIGTSYTWLGLYSVYFKEKKLDSAQFFNDLALEKFEELNYFRGTAQTLINQAKLDFKNKSFNTALASAKRARSAALKINNSKLILEANHTLYKLYKQKEHYGKALSMFEDYTELKNKRESKENQKAIIRSQVNNTYEKKYLADSLAREEQRKINELEQKNILEQEKNKRYLLYGGVGALFIVIGLISKEYIRKKRDNKIISLQKNEVEKQKEVVEEKNKEILDSITYAKRLQDAILPSEKIVKSFLLDSFILFKPKDIVAGDFYFMDVIEENNKKLIYYVAADCTGHGVPGAMVSIVGANGLKRCIQEFGLREPGKILDRLAELVATNFSQSEERIRDGMDLALCCLESDSNGIENDQIKRVHYAGANNPLWVINPNRKQVPENANSFKEGGGFEIKANKQAIGYTENITPFDTHTVELEPGDTLYTFSDGYPDQFGGDKGKKLKSANFRKMLFEIQDKTMDEQLVTLDKRFEEWRGKHEQIDDVCVIGVRI